MTRRIFLFAFMITIAFCLQSEPFDKVIKNDKSAVSGKVLRVTDTDIEIDPEGSIPFLTIPRNAVSAIIYSDNTIVNFKGPTPEPPVSGSSKLFQYDYYTSTNPKKTKGQWFSDSFPGLKYYEELFPDQLIPDLRTKTYSYENVTKLFDAEVPNNILYVKSVLTFDAVPKPRKAFRSVKYIYYENMTLNIEIRDRDDIVLERTVNVQEEVFFPWFKFKDSKLKEPRFHRKNIILEDIPFLNVDLSPELYLTFSPDLQRIGGVLIWVTRIRCHVNYKIKKIGG